MRHDPAGASIVIMLRSLKLHGMAHAVDDPVAQGAPVFEAATPMLSQLLKAEMAEREVRSITYHTKVARFPSYKDLAGFDFASSDINEATVRQLHRECRKRRAYWRAWDWQKPCRHGYRRAGHRASPTQGAFLLHRRIGQLVGARKGPRKGWQDG